MYRSYQLTWTHRLWLVLKKSELIATFWFFKLIILFSLTRIMTCMFWVHGCFKSLSPGDACRNVIISGQLPNHVFRFLLLWTRKQGRQVCKQSFVCNKVNWRFPHCIIHLHIYFCYKLTLMTHDPIFF